MKNYVEIIIPPATNNWLESFYPPDEAALMKMASHCNYCQNPSCCKKEVLDIPGIMRRISCGNFTGAKRLLSRYETDLTEDLLVSFEYKCLRKIESATPVQIREILKQLSLFQT